ncbi:MAG: bifunctional demethylmenaquinone methyltransferase/2-methoxy-6-polyprenyl-1,4-benzoquinol methylase UbiE [Opitutaceae bacterium]|nr:bifunctional demethylmenaquinone methyltransferase/2-methoxy-6-polyprenyl-1,4-benzoquinol methylase UbiE [Opitutaceae bacterium]
MPDPVAVQSMFGRIAHRYDLANRLLSGGTDVWWRWRLRRAVAHCQPQDVLDLATGSGDVAFALARGLPASVRITGMDFCQPMLDEAVAKKARAPGYAKIQFLQGDAMALPLPNASFDVLTISFGLRNVADRYKALGEMHRVLRPGGTLFVLEFSQPFRWFAPFYFFYLRHVLPHFASWLTGDRGAYEYLGGSIAQFPARPAMTAEITRAGFGAVRARPMTFGIVALHQARK